ncbi:Atu1372/SO_1960 family protein [Cystobacter fuscus]|uniref:Atu1372/SO_1960 family protein n=1 Tax=Cystobacter fuscus TaxID=43 RepID=UPI0037BE6E5E
MNQLIHTSMMAMRIQKLDHYTLRTEHVEETRRFLEEVAGLRVGPRPAFQFPGYWLYAGDTPLVHLATLEKDNPELHRYLGDRATGTGPGAIDHIAFRCADLPAFESRLNRLGVTYTPRTVPQLREHQVFVKDPNGITLEFIFAMDEAASWRTDASGVALPAASRDTDRGDGIDSMRTALETAPARPLLPTERLAELGLTVPPPPGAVAAYVPWTRIGNLVTTSFQLPWKEGKLAYVGSVGSDLTVEEAYQAARLCALNGLAQLQQAAGDLNKVRIVRIEGHVGCREGFSDIPAVLNGGSELINAVFGDKGRHARTALGHVVMPLNVPVMLGFWAEILE